MSKKTLTAILFDADKEATPQSRIDEAATLIATIRKGYTSNELPELKDYVVSTSIGSVKMSLLTAADRLEAAKREVTAIKAEASLSCDLNDLLDYAVVVKTMVAGNATLNALKVHMPDSVV